VERKFIDWIGVGNIRTHINIYFLLQDSSCGGEELLPLVHHPTCGLSKVRARCNL